MWIIQCFVDDKALPKALRGLTGLVIGKPDIRPMVNAVPGKNGPVAETSGSSLEMLAVHLKKKKVQQINAAWMRDFMGTIGKSPGSYSNLLRDAVATGLIKKAGGGTRPYYKVNHGKK